MGRSALLGTPRPARPRPSRALSALVVDDSETDRHLLASMLARLGFRCQEADGAGHALQAARRGHFDFVFMDLAMPGTDGLAATRRLRELCGPNGPYVVAVTGDASEGTWQRCEEAGMDDLLAKPVQLTALQRVCALKDLHELDRSRADFINAAAHALNTPLTAMRLQLALLEGHSPPHGKAIALLRRNVENLSRLARNLVAMARLQVGDLGVDPAPLPLADAARQAVEEMRAIAEQAGVALRLEACDAVAWAQANLVRQVLDNLLANAVQYTPAGGSVTLRVADGGDEVRIEVEDTGVGLGASELTQLFRPHAPLQAGRERGRMGLGLYVSQRIVESHGGRIWAHSNGPGCGARFTFVLPAAPGGPDGARQGSTF